MIQELLAGPLGPILIFLLRVADVSLGTMRMLLIVRGHRVLAPVLGFFETLLWVFAVGLVVQHLASPMHVVGYAGGFAAGNYVGLLLEERLALGIATIRAVIQSGGAELAATLRDAGFGVTERDGRGKSGKVDVLYSVVPRRRVAVCMGLIDQRAPEALIVVDEPRSVRRGWQFQLRRK